jgi:hypothetical protein
VIYVGHGSQFFGGDTTLFLERRSVEAYTPNLANGQVIGDTIYFPRQFGPLVPGGDPQAVDLFEQKATTSSPRWVWVPRILSTTGTTIIGRPAKCTAARALSAPRST